MSRISRILAAARAIVGGGVVKRAADNPFFHALLQGFAGNSTGEQFAEPYRQSAWVQRAIKLVAEPIADVPLKFFSYGGGGRVDVQDPMLAEFWAAPARAAGEGGLRISRAEFVKAVVGWLKLEGNAYLILDDTWTAAGARNGLTRAPLLIARPSRMTPVMDGVTLKGWLYNTGTGGSTSGAAKLLPEQVIQLKRWNPYHDILGMSEMSVARVAAEGDWLAGEFFRNLMRNNGDRGQIITSAPGASIPDTAQREEITRALREKRDLGQRGIFKDLFLGADLKVEDPKVTSADHSLVEMRLKSREEVATAFGIPMALFEVASGRSMQADTDRKKLIEDVCVPTAGELAAGMDQITARLLGTPAVPVYARFDFSQHSVVVEARLARFQTATAMFSMGIPVSEINSYLDLGLPEFDGWDVSYLPNTFVPADDAASDASLMSDPAFGEKSAVARTIDPAARIAAMLDARPVSSPALKIAAAMESRVTIDPIPAHVEPIVAALRAMPDATLEAIDMLHLVEGCGCGDYPASNQIIGRAVGKDRIWADHMRKRTVWIKKVKSKVTAELIKVRAEVLRKIEAASKYEAKTPAKRMSIADLMFSGSQFGAALWSAIRRVETQTLDSAGQELLDELPDSYGVQSPWKTPDPGVAFFLSERENLIKRAAENIFQRIQAALTEGVNKGLPYEQIADLVRAEFNDLSASDALRIAVTEVGAAYGQARDLAMVSAGVQFKEWLTSRNSNVRPAHQEAEGQQRGVEYAYDVGGSELLFPGDSSLGAGPELTINCHCISIAREKMTPLDPETP